MMNILLTSGGTTVPIDNVRSITNFSTGGFGKRIATAALLSGHKVMHLHHKDAPTPFEFKVDLMRPHQDYASQLDGLHSFASRHFSRYSHRLFDTYNEYAAQLQELCLNFKYDAVILCAAVSDYQMASVVKGKISSETNLTLELSPVPKLISRIKEWQPSTKLVGFKLLTNSTDTELIDAATKSLKNNNCFMVVANDLRDIAGSQKSLYFVKHRTIPTDNSIVTVASRVRGTSAEVANQLIAALTLDQAENIIVSPRTAPPISAREMQAIGATEVTNLFFG